MIIEYVQAKYGFDHVSQIVTYNELGVKSIIKNVGKVLGIPYAVTDDLSKNVPKTIRKHVYLDEEDTWEDRDEPVKTLDDLKNLKFFKDKIDNNEDIAQLFKIGKLFDGLPSSTGKHACGVIIGPKPLNEFVALMEVDGVLVSQFEKKASEAIGLLKMDFLGLITLDIEEETLRLIKQVHGVDVDLDRIPMDDKKVFELLQKGQSAKVFQLESQGMQNLLKKMHPTNFGHINAVLALYRPGPMQFIDNYLEGMKNPSKVHYPHPLYENSSKETYGILVYQEQIMQVVQDMAGFSLGEADILRRGIGKKDKQYIDMMEEEFSKRCQDNSVPEKTAKEVYAMIKKFAEYGFNKSHSAAYAMISYQTAYLKAHYPECFMAANCTINADDKDKLIPCLAEIRNLGIEILPPTLQDSLSQFSIEKHEGRYAIRYGLNGIEGIGEDVAKLITSLKHSPSLYEFIDKFPTIRTNQLSNLINGGVFDKWGVRKEMNEIVPSILETVKYHHKISSIYGRTILDDIIGEYSYEGIEYGLQEKMNLERKAIHICLNGHPLEQIRPVLKVYQDTIHDLMDMDDETDVQILCQIDDIQKITTKKGDDMCFLTLGDEFDAIEGVVFPKTYEGIEHLINEEEIVIVSGRIQKKEDNGEVSTNLIVNAMKKALDRKLRIYIDKDTLLQIKSDIAQKNGLSEIISVDSNNLSVHKEDFYVDYMKTTEYLIQNKIPFLA